MLELRHVTMSFNDRGRPVTPGEQLQHLLVLGMAVDLPSDV